MNEKPLSDNKIIYQISLTTRSLGALNPYLFIEQLKDKITAKYWSLDVKVVYHTKGETPEQPLVELKCFSIKPIADYELKNIKDEISFLAFSLEHELSERIEENRSSVA